MRLGIDLGTTRTVVAVAHQGDVPVVGFVDAEGDVVDYVPTLSAEVDGALIHGWQATHAARLGAPTLRSWKRLLATKAASDQVRVGALKLSMLELVTDYVHNLREQLRCHSNLPGVLGDHPEAWISVPANAHSTQRFVTLEGFRSGGFDVQAMLNEPSAAGLEYAHRYQQTITSRRDHVVIYDLGGGTFDTALVTMATGRHDVRCTCGVTRLGGDDFDEALLDLGLERAQIDRCLLSERVRAELLLECRAVKEGLHPNTRRIALEFGALGRMAPPSPVVIAVSEYYARVSSLVERTIDALDVVLAAPLEPDADAGNEPAVAGIYVVGGGSGLPAVPRMLRDRFGRRVHRSVNPSAATAIGLAWAADGHDHTTVTERFTRYFGVFRERDAGVRVSFDGIFAPGTPMPKTGEPPLVATRRYRAAHNVGFFRYVECAGLDEAGEPCGDLTPHSAIRFPFVRGVDHGLDELAIQRLDCAGPVIEERYEVDAAGVIAVTITDLDSGYTKRFVL